MPSHAIVTLPGAALALAVCFGACGKAVRTDGTGEGAAGAEGTAGDSLGGSQATGGEDAMGVNSGGAAGSGDAGSGDAGDDDAAGGDAGDAGNGDAVSSGGSGGGGQTGGGGMAETGGAAGQGIQQQKLLPDDGESGDSFGIAVSVDGDTALIGAPGNEGGSAYVFSRTDSSWAQQQKLLPEASSSQFGRSVSVDGDTALIGAGSSAYVFVRSGSSWTLQQKLLPDGDEGGSLGTSVSVNGDTALVGAEHDDDNGRSSGSAYVFVRSGSSWTLQQKLLPDDGKEGDLFGWSVSVDDDTALVSAAPEISGAAYVFVRSGGSWTLQQKLLGDDGNEYAHFGASVSLSGDTALVGADWDNDNGYASGAAYVFVRSGGSWTLQQKLLADDGEADDGFGWSVSVDGDTALVGAIQDDDNGDGSGSVYMFSRTGTSWAQQKLLADDGESRENFGRSVSVDGDTALVGANGEIFGSAYVLDLSGQ